MAIETELKFAVGDPSVFDRIAALEDLAGYTLDDRGIVHIRDTAFDTPDGVLYRGRAVFRLRNVCGGRFLTCKVHTESDGAYYRRIEEEEPTNATVADIVAGRLPDNEPVRLLRGRFGDLDLVPCLTTGNDRHIILLVRDGVARYELALDDVTFSGPRGDASIREIEVEARTDDHDDLDDIGAWLRDRFDLSPAGPSKFVLGMNLVGEAPA